MANQQTLDLLLQLWELFGTVCEGAAYLTAHPASAQMQGDIAAGLNALCRQLKEDGGPQNEEGGRASAAFGALAAELKSGRKWDNACARQLEQAAVPLAEHLSEQFSDAIKEEAYLPREQAQLLFAFCADAPRQGPAIYQLMFALCSRAAYSMPQESFEWTVRAMQEHPELLSGQGKAHPDYFYHPAPQRKFECCPICGGAGLPYYRALSYLMNTFEPPTCPRSSGCAVAAAATCTPGNTRRSC